MAKKKRSQEDAAKKILEKLAKKGSSHMYPFHKIPSKDYVASRATVHRAKDSLLEQELIKLRKVETHPGKDKQIYGLTFKGLLFALNYEFFPCEKAAEIRQKSEIKLPMPSLSYPDIGLKMPKYKLDLKLLEKHDPRFAVMLTEARKINELVRIKLESIQEKKGHLKRGPLIYEEIEKMFSEEIYSHLLKTVNILHYDEEHASHEFHVAMNKCMVYFWHKTFFENKPYYVKLVSECLKKDEQTRIAIMEAWLPSLAKAKFISKEDQKLFEEASKLDYQQLIENAEKILLGQKVRKLLR